MSEFFLNWRTGLLIYWITESSDLTDIPDLLSFPVVLMPFNTEFDSV